MNPFMAQQKKVPKVPELWKEEVNKYRLWIVLFFIGTLVIITLSIVAVILNGIGMSTGLIEKFREALNSQTSKGSPAVSYETARLTYIGSLIVVPSLMIGLVGISIILSVSTVIKSYQNQNFAKISGAGIFIIQLSAFFALINVVQFMWSGWAGVGAFPGSIYSTVVMFLYLPIWYFANKVSRIRKLFIYSQRVNSPEFQQQMEQMKQQFMNASGGQNFGGKSPFGFSSGSKTPQTPKTPNNTNTASTATKNKVQNTNQGVDAQKPQVSEADRQLSKLNMTQLRSIAQKLYISGYEAMKRDELIEHIKRTTK